MARCLRGSHVTHFADQPKPGGAAGSSLPSPVAVILQHFQRRAPQCSTVWPCVLTAARRAGYTLGLLAALGLSAVTWQLGKRVVAPLALRGVTEAERAERLARLNRTALSRTLLLLYLVYPGALQRPSVSVALARANTCLLLPRC